jgi:hypothetical protein
MEAWFPDFGYGLISPTSDEVKLIERTEATAFLTKHLQIYGGSGKYQGYKIGRVLKDIIFGAQGFVDKPANLESVIKVAANKVAASRVFVTAKLSELLEGGVEDVDGKQLKELQTKLEETQASLTSREQEIAELQKAAEEFKAKDYDGQIATLTKEVEELKVDAGKFGTTLAERDILQKQLDEVTKRAEKSEAELDGIRKSETARERLAKLSEVKKIEDEKATLAELREMTDETFEVVLKYAGEVKSSTDGNQTDEEGKTAEEKEAERAEAALNDVTEDNSADFSAASEDAQRLEVDQWMSTAQALCGRAEKEQGGE